METQVWSKKKLEGRAVTSVSDVIIDKKLYNFRHRKTISYNEFDLMKIGMQTAKEVEPKIKNQLCDIKTSETSDTSVGDMLIKTSKSVYKALQSSQNEKTLVNGPNSTKNQLCNIKTSETSDTSVGNMLIKTSKSVYKALQSSQNEKTLVNSSDSTKNDALLTSFQSIGEDKELKITGPASETSVKLHKSVWLPCMEVPIKWEHHNHLSPKILKNEKDDEYRPSCFVFGFDNTTNSSNTETSHSHKTSVNLKSNVVKCDKNVDKQNNSTLTSTFDSTLKETTTMKYKTKIKVENSKETLMCQTSSNVDARKDVKKNCSHIEMDYIPLQQQNGRSSQSADVVAIKGQKKNKHGVFDLMSTKQRSDEQTTSIGKARSKNLSRTKCPPISNLSKKMAKYEICQNYSRGHAGKGKTDAIEHTPLKKFKKTMHISKVNKVEFGKDGDTTGTQQKAKDANLLMYSKSSTTNSAEGSFTKISNQKTFNRAEQESKELRVKNVRRQNRYTSNSLKNRCGRNQYPSKLSVPLRKMVCKFCGSIFSRYTDWEAHNLIVHNYTKVKKFKFGNPRKRGCPGDSQLEKEFDSQLGVKCSTRKRKYSNDHLFHSNEKGINSRGIEEKIALVSEKHKYIDIGNSGQDNRIKTTFHNNPNHIKTNCANRIKQEKSRFTAFDTRPNRNVYPLIELVCDYCGVVFCKDSDLEAHRLIVHNQSTVKQFKYGNPRKRFPESLLQKQMKSESDSEFTEVASDF